jgi:hypothetical protein
MRSDQSMAILVMLGYWGRRVMNVGGEDELWVWEVIDMIGGGVGLICDDDDGDDDDDDKLIISR